MLKFNFNPQTHTVFRSFMTPYVFIPLLNTVGFKQTSKKKSLTAALSANLVLLFTECFLRFSSVCLIYYLERVFWLRC